MPWSSYGVARELTGDPVLGLHMGRSIEPRFFDVVMHAMLSSATLRESFSHLHRFLPLVSDGARLQLVEQSEMRLPQSHGFRALVCYQSRSEKR